MAFTIEDKIRQDEERIAKWQRENPGFEWCPTLHESEEPKFYITKEMLNSAAYRSLTKWAMLVLQDMLAKRDMRSVKRNKKNVWACVNNGEIVYPYSEALKRGLSKVQFVNAIDELQEKGFIDITHQGKGGRKPAKGMGDYSTYLLDDRWLEWGTDKFKPARNPRQKDNRRGRGFGAVWSDEKKRQRLLAKRESRNSVENTVGNLGRIGNL